MTTVSPTRPSRRAATRKKVILEESDEENIPVRDGEDEEDFTPAPKRSPRRQTRRNTTEPSQTPRSAAKRRTSKFAGSIHPTQILQPNENLQEPESPTKRISPRKRQSAPAPRKTPEPTEAEDSHVPEMPNTNGDVKLGPLNDVTQAIINVQATQKSGQNEVAPIKAMDTVLEKPMDIVIRSRALPQLQLQEDTGPKARTVIKNLILNNFKSYAGRQEVGPFHASFSSVVGPNGSGKSNVIDSLLFVFGFRASKMRQGKISALIHNSAAFPDLDHCEVEVHFEEVMDKPGNGHEVLPESSLIISRKAFKNNASKYYINGRESNFTDVTTLLKGRGVDLDHKRFLILQGEVESIAQMKPKAANEHDDGLLEYLEDIIGTSKFKTPIEESAQEVDTLNEVCTEKASRVQHVEKERNGLEDKKEKALAYIQNENELASKQSTLYQIFIHECEDNLTVTDEAIDQMQSRLNAELEKHQGNEDGIKQLGKSYKSSTRDYELLQKATQAVVKEMAKHDKENVKFDEKRKFLANKKSKLEKTLNASRLATSEARSLIQKHTDDVARKTSEVADLEKQKQVEGKELEAIRDGLKSKTQTLTDQITEMQKQLEPWNEKINDRQSQIAITQSELEILRKKASAGSVALEEAQAKTDNIQNDRQSKDSEMASLKSQKIQLEKEVNDLRAELERLTQSEADIRSKLSGARQRADEARASLASKQSQNSVLTGLMRLKESGRIEGFHGRLGNLGTIDQKYDIAISTACPSLDNLVVDSVEVGQQCIDYLRKNNLGRANIILLDRLARRDLSSIETPENVPRLFDLVKAKDEMFRPAFYSVLQNTLVAKNLEQANRIAYGARRWRVVTLDGQLIDLSGTMSGGGTRVAKGGMSSKLVADTTKDQVSQLELDRDQVEEALKALQERRGELEASVKESTRRLPKLETAIQKAALEAQSLEKHLEDATRRVKELSGTKSSSNADEARMKELENQKSKLENEISELRAETAGLEENIQSLQSKIMEVGGVRLRSQKAKVDGLKEQIDTLNEEVSDSEVARSKAEKQKAKQEKSFGDTENELATMREEFQKLDDEVDAHRQDASKSERKTDEAKEAMETKQEEMETLKRELDRKAAEVNETRAVEIEMRNKLDENQKARSESQKQLKYWNEKIKNLSHQSVSEIGEDQEAMELAHFTKDELQDMNKESLKAEIVVLEEKTQNVNVDLGVLAEYRRRVEEHNARSSDLQSAVAQRDSARKRCDEFRKMRLEGFMTGFSMISARLKEMYQLITMGGNAELELVDSLDPFSEGILFSVMPPKKSWKNISNLSGGEKTLSSLALVFALHHYKPTPLYVMDEIDAALDFRNVSIVASYIKERTKNAQFIVISLRNNMFELASRLVGVYKVNHMTKSVTVENRDYIVGRA